MASSARSRSESERETASAEPNLQTLNDLYSLELSQAFAQAIEAGMINHFGETDGIQAFRVEFCPQHQMVLLPTCPGCG